MCTDAKAKGKNIFADYYRPAEYKIYSHEF